MSKQVLFAVYILFSTYSNAQDFSYPKWNDFSENEENLKKYKIDSTAHAIVLNEIGYSFFTNNKSISIITRHYKKIKILDKQGFYKANIKLPYTLNDFDTKIKASITNFIDGKTETTYVKSFDIYTKKIDEYWVQKSFTFPNLKVGSIIEYYYEESSYDFDSLNDGWIFQSEIPKIKSTFRVKIPEYWQYHMSSVAIDNPTFEQNGTVKKCFRLGYNTFDCIYFEIELTDIPAFEEEGFTTSKKNYLKQIIFSKKVTQLNNKVTKKYTTSWNDIDKRVFEGSLIGKKYDKKRFMKRKIPDEILEESDDLLRAKNIYTFIQKHYKWNEATDNYNTRTAFSSIVADMYDINVSLINALNAADIPTDFALLSTRENGIPTKLYPTVSDFNYVVAYTKINNVDYFLDATDKLIPFGMLPFRCLNNDVRIFDKSKGSYWYNYVPSYSSLTNIYAIANLTDDNELNIKTRVMYSGYYAHNKRKLIQENGLNDYLDKFESSKDLNILEHEIQNIENINEPLIEIIEVDSETDFVSDNTIYLNPFIIKNFKSNPFNLESRNYPVDIGYKRKFQYNLVFNIPKNYKINSIPKNRNIQLPDNGGSLVYLIQATENKINIKFTFSLNKIRYQPEEYSLLKEYLSNLISAQNEMIILTKE